MSNNASHLPASVLLALPFLAIIALSSTARGADTAFMEDILREHRANIEQIQSLRYRVTEVRQQHSTEEGLVDVVNTGTMTLDGERVRLDFNFSQFGNTPHLRGNEQGVFLSNSDYAAVARPDVGWFKKMIHESDGRLNMEAQGHRDLYGSNIMRYVTGLDSTTRLEKYLEDLRIVWSQVSVNKQSDGTVVLALPHKGRDVVQITLASKHGFLVRSLRSFRAESHAKVVELDAEIGEFRDKAGNKVYLPTSVSERRFRSGATENSSELASSSTITIADVRVNEPYDKSIFKLETVSIIPDRNNVMMDIRSGRETILLIYKDGKWIPEPQASAQSTRRRAIQLPAEARIPRFLKWGGGALILLAAAMVVWSKKRA